MLGDLLNRSLVLVLGYAFPAIECFKAVEKNRVQIEELRFWCQYWILVAFLTVFERIGDMFISWLPMYSEVKLALLIYLWYPKTKGTGYVYETLLRPFLVRHETDVDRKIQELRVRLWDFALYYWQNYTELGQTKFLEMIHYLAGQSSSTKHGNQKSDQQTPGVPPPPPIGYYFQGQSGKRDDHSDDYSIPEASVLSKLQQALKFRRSKPHKYN